MAAQNAKRDLYDFTSLFWFPDDFNFTGDGAFIARQRRCMVPYGIEVGDRVELAKLVIDTPTRQVSLGQFYFCPDRCTREQFNNTLELIEQEFKRLKPKQYDQLMSVGIKTLLTEDFNTKAKRRLSHAA